MSFTNTTVKETLSLLNTNPQQGLTTGEATGRQVIHGKNELKHKKKASKIARFFMQFNDFMIIILISAAFVSFGVSFLNGEKDFIDPLIILIIVFLNATLGFVQENKAEKSLEALKKLTAPTAKVIRDSKMKTIEASFLVPGDIIVLETGDFVPADARLITCNNLRAEESALTGESMPIEKNADLTISEDSPIGDRKNMVFSGSAITYGRGVAVVTNTGMTTEVGRIAGMLSEDEKPETPLSIKLENTGKMLGIGALVICGFVFVMGILRDIPPFHMFMTSVSLAVAAIPEGLPAIVTIMLAMGVSKMTKQNAIVRKLPAVETLGSASVICSDKTGTLTQNIMTVVKTFSFKKNDNEIFKYASLCNDSYIQEKAGSLEVLGDPTEAAIIRNALKIGINKNEIEKIMPRIDEIPFDSKRKCMSTVHKLGDNNFIVVTKGAPDFILKKCTHVVTEGGKAPITEKIKTEILKTNEDMAMDALRVLCVCYKNIQKLPYKAEEATIEKDLIFLGLIAMMDPPREETKGAVETCKIAGIKPVMITGDHVLTAKAIARQIGIMEDGDKAITGEELNLLSSDEFNESVDKYAVFARVSPEHKMRIVKAFQLKGHIVAMTGDGVNDAPALKNADIGCAMGISGTDVAKGASDMILTDDNFATIVEAVKMGRGIFQNIRKSVHFLLSSNIGEILTIFVAILLGWQTPLLAIHLLWVNLVTDSLPAIALGFDPFAKDLMTKKPLNNEKSLFSDGLWGRICCEGVMIGLLSLLAFFVGSTYFDAPESVVVGRTMAFCVLSLSQLVHAFNMRSEHSIFEIGFFTNKHLVMAFFAGVILQCSVVTFKPLSVLFKVTQLDPKCWLIVIGLSILPLIIIELQKFAEQKSIKMVKYDYSKV